MKLEKKGRKRGRRDENTMEELSSSKKPPTSPTSSIKDLAANSLIHIFAFLSPEDRVRMERVSRQWRELVRKYGWIGFRKLTLDKKKFGDPDFGDFSDNWMQQFHQNWMQQHVKALVKYRALISRCGPQLRELSIPALYRFHSITLEYSGEFTIEVEQWAMMRNLHHLHFEKRVGPVTLRAIADNLTRLRSIHISDDIVSYHLWVIAMEAFFGTSIELCYLLRITNASLQALRLPAVSNSRGDSLRLAALPSSLRALHISEGEGRSELKSDRIEELLELAASCCPQLAILMLPTESTVNELSLAKLARFEKLFYLRIYFDLTDANLLAFGNTLAKIGAQLRALLLVENVDSRVLHLIAKHCPRLEHCYLNIDYSNFNAAEGERILSALQSVFQLPHLRSLSIRYDQVNELLPQIFAADKHNMEYLHLSFYLPLPVESIINLIQRNPMLRKLACAIQNDYTPVELDNLKVLLQKMEGPLELELIHDEEDDDNIPPELLEMGENSRVHIARSILPDHIDQTLLRQFCTRTMDSVPDDLDFLDDAC